MAELILYPLYHAGTPGDPKALFLYILLLFVFCGIKFIKKLSDSGQVDYPVRREEVYAQDGRMLKGSTFASQEEYDPEDYEDYTPEEDDLAASVRIRTLDEEEEHEGQ